MVPEPTGLGSQISVFKPSFCAQSAVDIPTIPAPTTIRSKSVCEVVELGKGGHLLDRVWGLASLFMVLVWAAILILSYDTAMNFISSISLVSFILNVLL